MGESSVAESGTAAGRTRAAWAGAALALLAALGALYAVMLAWRLVLAYDSFTLFCPYFTLVADFARHGQLLLWNPWSNCGAPDAAYVEMGSFSPVTLLLALLTGGGEAGFLLYWLCIWGVAGVGMLLLARRLGAPAWGGLTVALAFMFSGIFIGNATHTSWLYAFAFLPLAVWRLDVAVCERRLFPAVQAGALYGLGALAGHPALVIINGLFLACWACGRTLFPPETGGAVEAKPAWGRRLALAGLALVALLAAGTAVLAPTYAAFFTEAPGYSERSGALERDCAVNEMALPAAAFCGLASPYLPFGMTANQAHWGEVFVGLCCLYIGGLVPALAGLALLARPQERWRWWLLFTGLLFLGFAVGDALPLRGWLYELCPPTRFFRHSAVFRFHFLFALACLACIGLRELCVGGTREVRRKFLLAALACSGAAAAAALYLYGRLITPPAGALPFCQFALAWLAAPAAALLLLKAPEGRTPTVLPVALVALTLLDGAAAFYLSRSVVILEGAPRWGENRETGFEVDTVATGLYREPGNLIANFNLYFKVAEAENYSTLNSRFHTRRGFYGGNRSVLDVAWCDLPPLLGSVAGREDRIWFAAASAETPLSDRCFSAFLGRTSELGAMPLAVHSRAATLARPPKGAAAPGDEEGARAIAALPPAERVPVELLYYSPRELYFTVKTPCPGWLLVTDRWAAGWRATVDGNPAEVLCGNFLFRALKVDKGVHRVEFHYRPALYPWLLYLSWGTLAAVALASLRRSARRV